MTIPIKNIYFLLAYAWDRLEQANLVSVGEDDFKNIADLFATVLSNGVNHLLKRGIDRGYQEVRETIPGIRGRLDFFESLRRQEFRQGRACCIVEELTTDTIHNRVLAETVRVLLAEDDLDVSLRHDLDLCLKRLGPLSRIRLTRAVFARIQLHGNNAFYAFLLDICRLIHEAVAVQDVDGRRRFRDFLRDDAAMARLFERFLMNFFKREQRTFRASARKIDWAETWSSTDAGYEFLPGMRTDVYLESATRRIILDAKYYRTPLQSNFGKQTVQSAHLYQLYAYLRNADLEHPGLPPPEGVLLYAQVDRPFDLEYAIHGYRIRVMSLDLSTSWQSISESLLAITQT